jgi:2,4-dienoyl-CoA reductase-like NADH-dependent reductase (Old Yellow Enzyme family)
VLSHLLSPGRIGQLSLRNRIIMSPMGSNLAEPDGHMGERIKRYYEARAAGGAGLLIVGVGAISYPAGTCNPNQVSISDDSFLPDLQDLTRRIHHHGAKVAIQLQHAGKVAVRDIVDGRPMWVPSALPYEPGDLTEDLTADEVQAFVSNLTSPGAKMLYHEVTHEDIAQLIEMFASATDRARRAGFDAVELHAGHGYLLSGFLSPKTNKREDEYGGAIENRARLLGEVIRASKARTGDDFPIWCRLDAREYRTPGGITESDGQRAAELAAEAGADAIHVSAYADSTSGVAFTDAPLVDEPGRFVEMAAAIKARVDVPVIAVGRIEPEQGDALIRDGKADFIAMARKLLADPELPRKLHEDRSEDVRPCIYCYTCVGQIFLNRPTCCAVHPPTGREAELPLEPATVARRVLVIGGGPAGMEAARLASLRGHAVTLCERDERLGGTAFFSSLVYPVNGKLVEWLETQVRKLPIDLRLGREIGPEEIRALAPDVVLVAVGARRQAPEIPGADRRSVLSGDDLRNLLTGRDKRAVASKLSLGQRAVLGVGSLIGITERISLTRELSRRWMPIGKRVVVIGGGLVGVELAEFLAERGRTVSVVEPGPDLASEMAPPRRWRALYELREHGVDLYKSTRIERIEDEGVIVVDAEDTRMRLPADHVIVASGVQANRELENELRGLGYEVHAVGDCSGVGYIKGAMWDAAEVARAI